MKKILEGIRVLDWTIFQQGPVASMILGDLGADVIKIEERVGGDLATGDDESRRRHGGWEGSRQEPVF